MEKVYEYGEPEIYHLPPKNPIISPKQLIEIEGINLRDSNRVNMVLSTRNSPQAKELLSFPGIDFETQQRLYS